MGNRLWQLSNRSEHGAFLRQSAHLEPVQRGLLKSMLGDYSSTLWGRRYRVDAGWTYERFREEVPLHTYDDLWPYFSQSNGICPQPVLRWEPTGGSTGPVKWIPWTSGLQSQFRRAVSPWVNEMYLGGPDLRNGRSFWQLTPNTLVPSEPALQGQVGFAHDGDYLGRIGRLLEKLVLLSVEREREQFWEKLVTALVGAADLRYISCWSPTYLWVLRDRFESIVGPWDPERYWPRLQLISCWTQGPSQSPARTLESLFPTAQIAGKGLLSTEAVTTIPFWGVYPLAYRSHLFEFLTDDGRVIPSWELERGRLYEVVQTTAGGLVRYRSGDLIRVTGLWRSVPCLEFVAREATLDRFGEKLSHAYLHSVLASVDGFAAIGFEENSYVLFIGLPEQQGRAAFRQVRDALVQVYSYRDCLELGQLRPLRCFQIEGDALAQWRALVAKESAHQKWSPLLPEGAWSRRFQGRFVPKD